jgi:hypothetical protein
MRFLGTSNGTKDDFGADFRETTGAAISYEIADS